MQNLKKSIILTIVLMLLCGFAYPLAMTGISQLVFSKQANGSIIEIDGKKVGSEFLGQNFTDSRFFHGRISAVNYNTYKEEDKQPDKNGNAKYSGVASGSANLSPTNNALAERVEKDINEFLKANPTINKKDISTDLLTSSGSGLDPDISPQGAKIQIPAISIATNISSQVLEKIVEKTIEQRQLGFLGEPRVNVLKLNLEIYNILKQKGLSH